MIRVAVIGLGAMGRNHVRVLTDLEGVKLVAICDTDSEAVESLRQKHDVPAYTSWDEMLERETLDAVVVAVPTRFHLEAAAAVLARGCHVLVEKPIASDLEEGRRLVDSARRANQVLALGQIERFKPAVCGREQPVARGEIGR